MKKLFLLLLATLVLLGGEAFAQRRTTQEWVKISVYNFNFPMTVNYVVKNGEKVYDGPVKLDPMDDHSFVVLANHSAGALDGAISMKYSFDMPYGNNRTRNYVSETASFSGTFKVGEPHGKFVFMEDAPRRRDKKKVEATYSNGVPTAYKYTSEGLIISGGFSATGKLNGKWTITDEYKNISTYQFVNGVLVSGDGYDYDAQTKAMAIKFGKGDISAEELVENGYSVFTSYLDSADPEITIFYGSSEYIPWNSFGAYSSGNSSNSFFYLQRLAVITDAGLESWLADVFKSSANSYALFYKNYASYEAKNIAAYCCGLHCNKFKSGDVYYVEESAQNTSGKPRYEYSGRVWLVRDNVYGYFVSDKQLEKIKESYLEHNHKLLKNSGIANYFKQNSVEVEGVSCNVFSYDITADNGKGKGYTIEFNCRPTNAKTKAYRTYSATINVEEDNLYPKIVLSSVARIRNKYDDIADAKAAFNKEAENQLNNVNALVKEKQATNYSGVATQLSIFRNYVAQVNRSQINHNNLDATIKVFKGQTEVVKSFSGYVSQYIEAYKLDEQIKQKQIAKHTSTPIPTVANWSKNAKVEEFTKVIAAQQNVLKLWEQFSPLKAQVTEAHKQFGSSTDPVLSKYNAEYAALVNGKMTLEAGIEAFPKLLEEQKVVAEQWKTYSGLKSQLININNQICATKLAVMGTYSSWYDANFKPQTSLEAGIATYTKLAAIQKSANEYVPLYNKVVENNTLLADAIKPAKCAAKAYKLYFKELDLNWKSEGAVEHISAVLKKQMLLLEISKFSTLKEDEKRVKKLKLTDLDEIIKAYIDNKTIAEPQIEVKAVYAVLSEQTPTTAVKAEPQKSASKVEPKVESKAEVKAEPQKSEPKAKVATVPSVKAEEKPNNQPITAIKPGFGQYVEISPIFNSISTCPDTYSAHINYIAGYRFNKNLFLGVGTGLNLNFGHSTTFYDYDYSSSGSTHFDVYDTSLAMFSIPVYLHFRADFGKRAKLWNPYASISAGAQFGVFEPQQHLADRFYKGDLPGSPNFHPLHVCHTELSNHTRRNMEGFVSLDFGANRRLTDKLSIYLGVGYKVGLRNSIRAMIDNYSSSIYEESALTHGIKFTVGLSF